MKIAFFSDTHLGFDEKGERADDSFLALESAIELSGNHRADLIVISGDIFDMRIPSHSVLYKSIVSFSKAKNFSSNVMLSIGKAGEEKSISFSGIPILAIHGNHEYLGKGVRSALDLLDLSGSLIYFHGAKIVARKGSERVCIFGLGAVPEKSALDVIRYWSPKPEEGASNVLVLHQGFKDFMAVDDEMIASLSLDDLPKGFDLIVNGHLHWSSIQDLGGSIFLLAGSTIPTSIKKLEAEKLKGVFFFDTVSKSLDFVALPFQRKMFYHKIVFSDADADKVLSECRSFVLGDLSVSGVLKPLIRLNLVGTLKKGLSNADVDLGPFINEFSSKTFLSVSKNFSSSSFKTKISELRELQKEKLSIASVGFELLEKNLAETDFGKEFDAKKLFELLGSDELDEAMYLFLKS
jgi:DNA repair exonuclease SbcCD nuclease subunit